jgi:hypothetical protein
MSIIQKIKNATVPSVFSAGASLGIYYVLIDGNLSMEVPFANMQLPIWAAVGGASFIGAELSSLVTEFVVPKIPVIKDLSSEISAIVPPVVSGLSTYAVMRGLISEQTEFKNSFLIGAGGDLVGKYAYGSFGGSL